MSNRPHDEPSDVEHDEVQRILDALQQLARRAPSPVVRLCLEEARRDIAHLAGVDDRHQVGGREADEPASEHHRQAA
jgi:hypothetical protein